MAKRVKKGFRMELRDDTYLVVAQEHRGRLRMKESSARTYDAVDLTAAMCEAAGILDALEDVLEPWERLRDALHQAAVELGRTSAHPVYQLPSDVLVRAAALLGLEPEGE